MEEENKNPLCALSFVQQPPPNGTKMALWVYLQAEVVAEAHSAGLFCVSHNNYRH